MSGSLAVVGPSSVSGALAGLDRHLMRTYPRPEVAFVAGRGARLIDADGGEWLDLLSGLAVTSLGHAHPAVTEAVCAQAGALVHTSNLFATLPAIELAARLGGLLGWPDARTFLAQCGATANEAAIKLARRHGKRIHPEKVRVVTLEGSFHGRTLATLEATGQPAKHAPFAPLAGFVDTVPHDDPAALEHAVGPMTCAVLLEVVQGEGGVRPLSDEVLVAARRACDAVDALLVIDEVQTGMGRTGSWFAFQGSPVVPDVVTIAKALANGLPVGACVARGSAAEVLGPGDHATTFGGNPVTCAAALAVIRTIEEDRLLERVRSLEERFRHAVADLRSRYAVLAGVRGRGLLLGLELRDPVARRLEAELRRRRVIVGAIGDHVVRLAPPFVLTDADLSDAVVALDAALAAVMGGVDDAGEGGA